MAGRCLTEAVQPCVRLVLIVFQANEQRNRLGSSVRVSIVECEF